VPAGVAGECQILVAVSLRTMEGKGGDGQGLLTGDGWLRTVSLATRNRLGLIGLMRACSIPSLLPSLLLFFFFVGRAKDVITSAALLKGRRELEEAMLAPPAVARAVALGLRHPEKGEIPVAGLVNSARSSSEEVDLTEWCRQQSRASKAPRRSDPPPATCRESKRIDRDGVPEERFQS